MPALALRPAARWLARLALMAPATLLFGAAPARFEFSQAHMGTLFRIVLYAEDQSAAERASGAAFARIAALDAALSDYRDGSELMALCRQAGGPAVRVSQDLFRVLAEAQAMARRSGGAFDVTVGPVVRLWRRARRTGQWPDAPRLAEARARIGYRELALDRRTRSVRLAKPGMLLDLGGIAKGFAAAEALAVLEGFGIRSALVAGGGDIVVSEAPPGAAGWRIAIAPLNRNGTPPPRLLLRNAAVSTSGDAEQAVEIGGVRYSHIIDPRTGRAVVGRSSVTVVAPAGALADALATAASVLGPRRGLRLVDATPGAAALFLQASGAHVRVYPSKRWNAIVTPAD